MPAPASHHITKITVKINSTENLEKPECSFNEYNIIIQGTCSFCDTYKYLFLFLYNVITF